MAVMMTKVTTLEEGPRRGSATEIRRVLPKLIKLPGPRALIVQSLAQQN